MYSVVLTTIPQHLINIINMLVETLGPFWTGVLIVFCIIDWLLS